MPLSEHEQRLLDQIERQLYAEDPKFASAVRSHDVKTHLVRRIKRFVALLALGLTALMAGVVLHLVVVGVAGFLVMLGAGLVILRSIQRLRRGDAPPPPPRTRAAKAKKAGKSGTLRERAEERFRRRFEDPE